jgi:DNA invertase Pin-like site-specific DNA recombinase
MEATAEYAEREFGADLPDLEYYTDKSTGTDTARDGYHDLLDDMAGGDIDAVVANSVSRVSRSIRDLDKTVETIVDDHDSELHIVSEGLRMTGDNDPYQKAMLQLLGVFAELEAEMIRQRVREGIQTRMNNDEYHHGPAPLGFTKNDGHLIEADGYDRVRTTLELVQEGELSKRKAARELDTSRRTINRALDRAELYNLAVN